MSNNLKIYRIKHDLTQKELAYKMGVTPQTYTAWEANPGVIKVKHANRLAQIFGVTLDAIFRTQLDEKSID